MKDSICLTIHLALSLFSPPLGVFLTLIFEKPNNRNWLHWWINLALTMSPLPIIGSIHAIWFIVKEKKLLNSCPNRTMYPLHKQILNSCKKLTILCPLFKILCP